MPAKQICEVSIFREPLKWKHLLFLILLLQLSIEVTDQKISKCLTLSGSKNTQIVFCDWQWLKQNKSWGNHHCLRHRLNMINSVPIINSINISMLLKFQKLFRLSCYPNFHASFIWTTPKSWNRKESLRLLNYKTIF